MIESIIYREEDLCEILHTANRKRTPIELINNNINHVRYLNEYLGKKGLNAKFYLSEPDYISVDYLTDYSSYYSKSFVDYGNKCVRLHFFTYDASDKNQFDESLTLAILQGKQRQANIEFWGKFYLGFVVVRPIPKFIIGYTILKHYNFRQDFKTFDRYRNYWGIKTYDVHVFGNSIKVESLAFLSQDSNVAACATIAIWCMLQIAVENYYINLKSPYEITQDSGITVHDGNRVFPNNGLNEVAICNAITKCNLDTERRSLKNIKDVNRTIKRIVHAYSRMRLPIILGLTLNHNGQTGNHAAAIAGFRLDDEYANRQISKANAWTITLARHRKLLLRSDYINKVYMHDDQWGPFSRCEFKSKDTLSTSWNRYLPNSKNGKGLMIIIPVFKKVRIPYEDIEKYTFGLNNFLGKELGDEIFGNFAWDIQLYLTSDFKEEVQQSGLVDINNQNEKKWLEHLLMMPMPKYIWVSTLYINGIKILHFVHDATGLRHITNLLFAFSYYEIIIKKLLERLYELKEISKTNSVTKTNLEVLFTDSIDRFTRKISTFI